MCPLCREKIIINKLQVAYDLDFIIKNLPVKCINSKEGCEFLGTYSQIEHHLKEICEFDL